MAPISQSIASSGLTSFAFKAAEATTTFSVDPGSNVSEMARFLQLFERDQGRCVYCGLDLKADYDQAMFLIGASTDGSGINVRETLRNDNFRSHPALGALLEWHARCAAAQETRTAAARALTILRRIQAGLAKGGCIQVKVELPDEVATYLLNQKRAELFRLEKQSGLKIQISGQPGLPSHQFNLEFVRNDAQGGRGENAEGSGNPEDPDRQAIEELKEETKEGFLKKYFWPPAIWRGIRKASNVSSRPPAPAKDPEKQSAPSPEPPVSPPQE